MPSTIQQMSTSNKETKTDRPGFLKVPPTVKDSRKLFVGGLPTDITEEEFRIFFEQYGTIVDSTVMIDRVTHRSRGFGFVTFEEESVSKLLLNQNDGTGKLEMRGKEVELKQAQPKASTRVPLSPVGVVPHYFDHYSLPYYPAPVTAYYQPTSYELMASAPAPGYPVYGYPYVGDAQAATSAPQSV